MQNKEINVPILEPQNKKWQEFYIDISNLQNILTQISQEPILDRNESSDISIKHNLDYLYTKPSFGPLLKSFITLANQQFKKFHNNFLKNEKDLYRQLNQAIISIHLIEKKYTIEEVLLSFSDLINLAYEIKQYIIDNMTILVNFCKEAETICYPLFNVSVSILFFKSHLEISNSDIEYILQFKLIDETCAIVENYIEQLYTFELTNQNKQQCKRILDIIVRIDDMINPYQVLFAEWFYYIDQRITLYNNKTNIIMPSLKNPLKDYLINDNEVVLTKLLSEDIIKKESLKKKSSFDHKFNLTIHIIHILLSSYLHYDIFKKLLTIQNGNSSLIWGSFIFAYSISTFIYLQFFTKHYKSILIFNFLCIIVSKVLIILFKDKEYMYIFSRLLCGIGCNVLINKNYISIFTQKNDLPLMVMLTQISKGIGIILAFIPFSLLNDNKWIYSNYVSGSINMILLIICSFKYISPNNNDFTVISHKHAFDNYPNKNKVSYLFPEQSNNDDERANVGDTIMTIRERNIILKKDEEFQKKNTEAKFRSSNKIPEIINSLLDEQTYFNSFLGKTIIIILLIIFLLEIVNESSVLMIIKLCINKNKTNNNNNDIPIYQIIVAIILFVFSTSIIPFIISIVKSNRIIFIIIVFLLFISFLFGFIFLFIINDSELKQLYNYWLSIGAHFLISTCTIILSNIFTTIMPPNLTIKNIITINSFYYFNYIGKILGIAICIFITNQKNFNHYYYILSLTLLFISFILFIIKFKYLRIKSLTRIMSSLYYNKLK